MIARERGFQRFRRHPLEFLDAPVPLGPCLVVYAILRRVGPIGLVDVVHVKARVVSPESGVDDVGPAGEAVSVTLMAPTWEHADAWLPAVWEQCEARRALRHRHLARLRTWGVVPGGAFSGVMSRREEQALAWIGRDHVEGTPLSRPGEALAARPAAFVRQAIGLADAVRALHGQGMFGRGVVPDQVLRAADGRLILLDVPWTEATGAGAAPPSSTDALVRSDLFGLGRCLYALFTGEDLEINEHGGIGQALAQGLSRGRPDIGSIVARLLTSSDRERFHRIEDVLARLESTTV